MKIMKYSKKSLKKARKKISSDWKNYRRKKATIKKNFKKDVTISRKIKEIYKETILKNSEVWQLYRDKKFSLFFKNENVVKAKKKTFKNKKVYYFTLYDKSKLLEFIESEMNEDVIYMAINVQYLTTDKQGISEETYLGDSFTIEGWRRTLGLIKRKYNNDYFKFIENKHKNLFEKYLIEFFEFIKVELAFSYYK